MHYDPCGDNPAFRQIIPALSEGMSLLPQPQYQGVDQCPHLSGEMATRRGDGMDGQGARRVLLQDAKDAAAPQCLGRHEVGHVGYTQSRLGRGKAERGV